MIKSPEIGRAITERNEQHALCKLPPAQFETLSPQHSTEFDHSFHSHMNPESETLISETPVPPLESASSPLAIVYWAFFVEGCGLFCDCLLAYPVGPVKLK